MPSLHLPTMLIMMAVAIVGCGMMLILARGRNQNSAAMALWGGAMMVGGVGLTVLALEPSWGITADQVGNAAILLGTALAWTGARVFEGRVPRFWSALAGPAAWLLWGAIPSHPAQANLAFVIGALYILATANELWRGRDEQLRSRNAAIALLLLHAVVYFARGLFTSLDSNSPLSRSVATVLIFESLLHAIGMAFMLLAIMKERAELQNTIQLRQLTLRDELTGLGNRRHFDQAIEHEFQRAMRNHSPLALLMLDADNFKAYNDKYGHQSGDECLRAVASAIRSATRRPGDVAVRYGGEEFAVLMAETDEAGAVAVAVLIHDNIAASGIEHAGNVHGHVTVSIGAAATVPIWGDQWDELVRAADRALYEAKVAGRDMTRTAGQSTRPVHTVQAPPRPTRGNAPATGP